MKVNSLTKIIVLLVFFISGCKEFFEPNIEKKNVVLLAPVDGTASALYTQTFWWNEVDDALHYRLQVVSPDFINTQRLILDTLITGNKFNFTMDPGYYQWRVRAENGSTQTPYTVAGFVIYSSSVKAQQPQLVSPVNNLLTNVSSATFKWLKLYGADKYHLEVDTNNFADTTVLFLDKTIPDLQYTTTLSKDKIYQWRVKALNDTASSKWSAVQNFTFDSTPPAQIVLTAPATAASVASPVTLTWGAESTAAKYQLYVYKSDQTTAYSSSYPQTVTGTSATFTGTSGDKVYWQVRAIDAVGNVGAFSTLWNFTVQ
ncbi:hypothetical protein [Pedobacter sp. L105]|uniref:hypothetical protein n=1 Tax=Pedobacter sp. L105 TaxID=1641871 RepID=UPI00131D32F8|nr:hypothetical protein [Pedobacter sp. L105]